MADPVSAFLLIAGASAGTAAAVGTAITVASTAFTLYSAFQTTKLPDGPRLGDLSIQTSTYGSAIPKVYGTDVVKGNIIWLRDNQIQENFKTVRPSKKTKQKIPTYSATYALALGEGIVSKINKIWIDGKLTYKKESEGNIFKLSKAALTRINGKLTVVRKYGDIVLAPDEVDEFFNDFNFTFYSGDYLQEPNAVMQSLDPDVSAFRGISYLFFNRLNLEKYGNRIPDMTIELFRETVDLEEEQTVTPIQAQQQYLANNENLVSYAKTRCYLNNTFIPREVTGTVQIGELFIVDNQWVTTRKCRPTALQNVSAKGIQYTFATEVLAKGADVVGAASPVGNTDPLLVTYVDTNNPGTVYTSKLAFYILDYFCEVSNTNATSSIGNPNPTDGTILPQLTNPTINTIYPWDFPFAPNEPLVLSTSDNALNYRLLTIPVANSSDLHLVLYSPTTATPHIGLMKTINGRVVIKRLTGLRETLLPSYPEIFLGNGRQPQDWAAFLYNNNIYLYNSRGYYKAYGNYISPGATFNEYIASNFPGFVIIPNPENWGSINEGVKSPTIQSYFTTVASANGYYVSKLGLNNDTQITDWEYVTTWTPKCFIIDNKNNRALALREIHGTPIVADQATFFSNQRLCLLADDFKSVVSDFTYTLPTSSTFEILNCCRFVGDKAYLVSQNRTLICDLTASTVSFASASLIHPYPVSFDLDTGNDEMTVVGGDYMSGYGRESSFGYLNEVQGSYIQYSVFKLFIEKKSSAVTNNGVITLGEILSNEIKSTGYLTANDIDVTDALNTNVAGITFARQGSVGANLQALAEAYFYFLYEEDYKIKAQMRVNLIPELTITDDFLNAREVGQTGFILKNNRPSSYRMPAIFECNYRDPALLYETNTQTIERAGFDEPTKQNIELPMVLSQNTAKNILSKIIKQVYIQSEGEWELTIPAIYSHLEAGQYIIVNSDTYGTYQLLIKSIDKGRPGIVKIIGIKEDPTIYGDTTFDLQDVTFTDREPYEQNVSCVVIDSLPFDANQDGIGFYVAAWNDQSRSTGYGLIQSQDNFLTYESLESYGIRGTATALMATTTLPSTTITGIYNNYNTLTLAALSVESLPSVSLTNAYTAFYGRENRWELIRFTDVLDNGDKTYTISNILRGYKGTENFVGTHEPGDYLIIVNGALGKLNYANEELGNTYQYRVVVPGESNQERWPSFTKTLTGFGREPIWCAHPHIYRNNSNDIIVNWVDQSRYGIQLIDRVSKTQDESIQEYTLSILNSSDVVLRTVTVTNATTYTYTSAMQVTDFGSNQSNVKIGLTKNSAVMGAGLLRVFSG